MLSIISLGYTINNNLITLNYIFYIRKPVDPVGKFLCSALIKIIDNDTNIVASEHTESFNSDMTIDTYVSKTTTITCAENINFNTKKITLNITDSHNYTSKTAFMKLGTSGLYDLVDFSFFSGRIAMTNTYTIGSTVDQVNVIIKNTTDTFEILIENSTVMYFSWLPLTKNTHYEAYVEDYCCLVFYVGDDIKPPATELTFTYDEPLSLCITEFQIPSCQCEVNFTVQNQQLKYIDTVTGSNITIYEEDSTVQSTNENALESTINGNSSIIINYDWNFGGVYYMSSHMSVRDDYMYTTMHIKRGEENTWTYLCTTKKLYNSELLDRTIQYSIVMPSDAPILGGEFYNKMIINNVWATNANNEWLDPTSCNVEVANNVLNPSNNLFSAEYDGSLGNYTLAIGYNKNTNETATPTVSDVFIQFEGGIENTNTNGFSRDHALQLKDFDNYFNFNSDFTAQAFKFGDVIRFIISDCSFPYYKILLNINETEYVYYNIDETIIENAGTINIGDTITVTLYGLNTNSATNNYYILEPNDINLMITDVLVDDSLSALNGGYVIPKVVEEDEITVNIAYPTLNKVSAFLNSGNFYLSWSGGKPYDIYSVVMMDGTNILYNSGFTILKLNHIIQVVQTVTNEAKQIQHSNLNTIINKISTRKLYFIITAKHLGNNVIKYINIIPNIEQ